MPSWHEKRKVFSGSGIQGDLQVNICGCEWQLRGNCHHLAIQTDCLWNIQVKKSVKQLDKGAGNGWGGVKRAVPIPECWLIPYLCWNHSYLRKFLGWETEVGIWVCGGMVNIKRTISLACWGVKPGKIKSRIKETTKHKCLHSSPNVVLSMPPCVTCSVYRPCARRSAVSYTRTCTLLTLWFWKNLAKCKNACHIFSNPSRFYKKLRNSFKDSQSF